MRITENETTTLKSNPFRAALKNTALGRAVFEEKRKEQEERDRQREEQKRKIEKNKTRHVCDPITCTFGCDGSGGNDDEHE